MIKDIKIEDLKVTLKSFNKDDLLVIFVPSNCSQDDIIGLQEVVEDLKIENNVLLLSNLFDVKKIDFIGVEKKKVEEVEIKDDVVYIKFVEK